MREIKFRAWDVAGGYWLDADFIVHPDGSASVLRYSGPDGTGYRHDKELLLSQFTGLQDRNGTDVYEGDVLQHPGDKEIFVVRWNNTMSAFRAVYDDNANNMLSMQINAEMGNAAVIGNIYENPELLEQT